MPKFAAETFSDWYRRSGKKAEGTAQVVLYPDIFNDCFFPETLKAALEVLEHYGYAVALPEERPPAVRPPIDYGMLDYAKRQIERAIRLLHPFLLAGLPIVILEPSTAAVFRDELPDLFPQHQDGRRLTGLTCLLSEFMEQEGLEPPQLPGTVIFHGHCHQKAVLNVEAARSVLAKMGLKVEEPQPGCCGMAGSFGFERDKYEISMAIGETNLLPAVRKAEMSTYIVADGFSCRTQIMDGTGRKVLHMAELLQLAFSRTASTKNEVIPWLLLRASGSTRSIRC